MDFFFSESLANAGVIAMAIKATLPTSHVGFHVTVQDFAAENIGNRRQRNMRVWTHIDRGPRRAVSWPEVIKEDKGSEHLARRSRQHTPHHETPTEIPCPSFDQIAVCAHWPLSLRHNHARPSPTSPRDPASAGVTSAQPLASARATA